MMKALILSLSLIWPLIGPTWANAETDTPNEGPVSGPNKDLGPVVELVEGKNYQLVKPEQPTQTGDNIEVLEIFWFGCPHCYDLEPYLTEWSATLPCDVELRRMPGIFSKNWETHAATYYAAEQLGVLDKIYQPLFDAIHKDKKPLSNIDALANFMAKHGVDEKAFKKAYQSVKVDTNVRKAKHMSMQYGITGVPAVVVAGKYRTSGSMADGYTDMLKVVDALVDKVRNDMDQTQASESP